jgi:predicted RNase H-like HicB family nuclease
MKTIQLKNIVWQEGQYFIAQCLNVEVSSFGETKEEALLNLEEALALYFEDMPSQNLTEVTNPEIISSTVQYA